MKDYFEKFAQMDWVTWLSMMAVALCATIVRLLIEAKELTLKGFIISSFMAAFLAYLVALYCLAIELDGKMMGVVVGFVTYQAVNILTGLGKLGAAFAKDPIELFNRMRNNLKR